MFKQFTIMTIDDINFDFFSLMIGHGKTEIIISAEHYDHPTFPLQFTSLQRCSVVKWLKYCRYGVKFYRFNQSNKALLYCTCEILMECFTIHLPVRIIENFPDSPLSPISFPKLRMVRPKICMIVEANA